MNVLKFEELKMNKLHSQLNQSMTANQKNMESKQSTGVSMSYSSNCVFEKVAAGANEYIKNENPENEIPQNEKPFFQKQNVVFLKFKNDISENENPENELYKYQNLRDEMVKSYMKLLNSKKDL